MKKITQTIHHGQQQAGFTLIELMVSLALFTIVVMAAVSSLYAVNNASRKVNEVRGVLDNLNFAVESMSRTIRTGSNIICGGEANPAGYTHNCIFPVTSSSRLEVSSTLGVPQQVEYMLDATANQIVKRTNDGTGWTNWIAITAPEIKIQSLLFYVSGADPSDPIQPNVIIQMQGVATATDNTSSPFSIQTYLSQRAVK